MYFSIKYENHTFSCFSWKYCGLNRHAEALTKSVVLVNGAMKHVWSVRCEI